MREEGGGGGGPADVQRPRTDSLLVARGREKSIEARRRPRERNSNPRLSLFQATALNH